MIVCVSVYVCVSVCECVRESDWVRQCFFVCLCVYLSVCLCSILCAYVVRMWGWVTGSVGCRCSSEFSRESCGWVYIIGFLAPPGNSIIESGSCGRGWWGSGWRWRVCECMWLCVVCVVCVCVCLCVCEGVCVWIWVCLCVYAVHILFISNPNFDRLSLRFSKIRATWSATAEPQVGNS